MNEANTELTTGIVSTPSGLLACGHPGHPNNLRDGKCGTCQCADEWDKLAKKTNDPDLKVLTAKIAGCFRSGSMVYDRNGKTLMQIANRGGVAATL